MRRANTSWHNGDYDVPAGHLDGDEAGTVAAAREGKEELGVDISPNDLEFVLLTHGLFADGKEYYNVYFRVRHWHGEPAIMEADKCDHLAWFSYDSLPDNLTPNMRIALTALREGKSYVEYGFSSADVTA